MLVLLSGIVLSSLVGCGGGGGGSNSGPGPSASSSTVSGTVTDLRGSPIVGATVTLGSQSATSTQFGTYVIPNVIVPAGKNSVVSTITATATVNGHSWSGQNTVEVLSGQANTSNVHIVLSDVASQGTITGTVRSASNTPLSGARVFAGVPDPNGGPFFTNLSSFTAYTDQNGSYTLAHLPPGTTYTVTASFAGYLNQTMSNVTVTVNTQTPASFTLSTSSGSSTVPVAQNLSAISITMPAQPSRATGQTASAGVLNAIRHFILQRRGLLGHQLASPANITLNSNTFTRSTPSGSIIEDDLFWDYAPLNNLLGYTILRSINVDTQFVSIALVRDPLADRFSDVDPVLTPDTLYYYSVARLDTIAFPANGTEGDPVNPPVVVEPLGSISLSAPNSGATVTGAPTFTWTSVSRATKYQILVYDRFPNYQSDTDPNGVPPIWPADPNNPGTSLVNAPTTTQAYQGPALTSGHTYYWAVLASDNVNSAFTVSPLQSFVAQ